MPVSLGGLGVAEHRQILDDRLREIGVAFGMDRRRLIGDLKT